MPDLTESGAGELPGGDTSESVFTSWYNITQSSQLHEVQIQKEITFGNEN